MFDGSFKSFPRKLQNGPQPGAAPGALREPLLGTFLESPGPPGYDVDRPLQTIGSKNIFFVCFVFLSLFVCAGVRCCRAKAQRVRNGSPPSQGAEA